MVAAISCFFSSCLLSRSIWTCSSVGTWGCIDARDLQKERYIRGMLLASWEMLIELMSVFLEAWRFPPLFFFFLKSSLCSDVEFLLPKPPLGSPLQLPSAQDLIFSDEPLGQR